MACGSSIEVAAMGLEWIPGICGRSYAAVFLVNHRRESFMWVVMVSPIGLPKEGNPRARTLRVITRFLGAEEGVVGS